MKELFNTQEMSEVVGVHSELAKASKGSPQYEAWLEKFRAKMHKEAEDEVATKEPGLSKKQALQAIERRLNNKLDWNASKGKLADEILADVKLSDEHKQQVYDKLMSLDMRQLMDSSDAIDRHPSQQHMIIESLTGTKVI